MRFSFTKKVPVPEDPPRKYFEVWGEALESVRFLQRVSLSLVFIVVFLIVLLNRAQDRAPLVIRVNEVGKAEPVENLNTASALTKPEVLNFARLFLKYFLERNVYTWEENLVEAGHMMTPSFRERLNSETNLEQETSAVQTHRLTSKLHLTEIKVLRETRDHLIVSVKGWRKISSYSDPAFSRETIFESELSLEKTRRSMEAPYGLLVDTYKETVFKDE